MADKGTIWDNKLYYLQFVRRLSMDTSQGALRPFLADLVSLSPDISSAFPALSTLSWYEYAPHNSTILYFLPCNLTVLDVVPQNYSHTSNLAHTRVSWLTTICSVVPSQCPLLEMLSLRTIEGPTLMLPNTALANMRSFVFVKTIGVNFLRKSFHMLTNELL